MARGDISVRAPITDVVTANPIVVSGTTSSILAGEPAIVSSATGAATGAVKAGIDGNPTTVKASTSTVWAGLAKSDSTETTTVAGRVNIILPFPGLIYSARAKTASTVDTQAEIDALFGKRVVLDLTSTTWSVDVAATDAITNGIVLVGGVLSTNPTVVPSEVFFIISPNVTLMSTGAGT